MTPGNESSGIAGHALDWSLRRRLDVPAPVPGYFDRPALIERLVSDGHNITVLKAPGGFGKTTLLAAHCRLLAARGLPVAWMRIDAADTRASIEACLAFALRHAGVEVPDPGSDAWSMAGDHAGLLLGAVAACAGPCVLTLDNLERLGNSGCAKTLNALLRDAPANLHVTMACRDLPFALDLAEPLLEGRAIMLSAAELRFSPQETAMFLDGHLSRNELSAVDRQFAGWPIALAIHRNAGRGDSSGQADGFNLLGNWIESRLWEHLSSDQRDFLLDAGLLDRLDPVLLDEVLDGNDSRFRLQGLTQFDGLIQPGIADTPHSATLHPMLRRHCAQRRIRETPERFQAIHHRAALALERRGETVASMRHAAEAGDPDLLGRLIEDAGGIRLWARRVQPPLREVIVFLTHDVIKRWPRLALNCCYVLMLTGRISEARRFYELASASSEGFTRNPGGKVRDLRTDRLLVELVSFVQGCLPADSAEFHTMFASASALARDDDLDPVTNAILNIGLCVCENRRGRFDAAFKFAEQVRHLISDGRTPYLSLYIDTQLGSMAMAQGHVQEAETYYSSALRSARTHYPDDPVLGTVSEALLRELQYERNQLSLAVAAGMNIRDNFTLPGNVFVSYTSESVIIAEVTQYLAGDDEALAALTEMTEFARLTKRQTLVRYLAALRVAALACAGRVAEAERAWRAEALPSTDDGCLDLQGMEWREMEMIACARLRLYAAGEAFEAGREFSQALLGVARDYRLVRTAMRGYAISMALEWRAGDMDAACVHLTSFLHHYTTTDYARPVLREGDAGREVLEHLLAAAADGPIHAAATGLLAMISGNEGKDKVVSLSERELAVLNLLPNLRDKEIAAELSISREGVRYHLRRVFAKLGVNNRREAIRQARSIGLRVGPA